MTSPFIVRRYKVMYCKNSLAPRIACVPSGFVGLNSSAAQRIYFVRSYVTAGGSSVISTLLKFVFFQTENQIAA